MDETAPRANDVRFSLADVGRDALGSLRADLRAHLGLGVIVLALLATSCCVLTCLLTSAMIGLGAVGGIPAGDPSHLGTPFIVAAVGFYVLVFAAWMIVFLIHQTAAMELARARGRSAPITMRAALEVALKRTPRLLAHVGVRLAVEGGPMMVVYAAIFALMRETGSTVFALRQQFTPLGWVVLAVGYAAIVAFSLGFRAFFGLAFASVALGDRGPLASFGASRELLHGRRLHFVAFRVAVLVMWLAIGIVFYAPWFAAIRIGGPANPFIGLLLLPLMLLLYVAMVALMSLDAIAECCYYERLTRPLDSAALARTFE